MRALQLAGLVACIAVLITQLYRYGPTTDPDPDGYVSYANGLSQTWVLQEHRRLPGYPFIITMIDRLSEASVNVDMFWFHMLLIIVFALTTTVIIWYYFGYANSLIYLMIFSYHSYFARNAIIMIADLPFVVVFYAVCASGIFFMLNERKNYLWACLFFILCSISTTLHPSTNMRLQVIFATAIVVLVGYVVFDRQAFRSQNPRSLFLSLVCLSVLAFVANFSVLRAFQIERDSTYLGDIADVVSSSDFLDHWVSYRMLLCLPPAAQPTAIDTEVDQINLAVSKRIGYPVSAVVPPGEYPEYLQLMRRKVVSYDWWKSRLWENPLALVKCTLSELRAKYHYTIRNLTPFTDFDSEKTWITPGYPPDSSNPRDRLFWTTGISLVQALGTEAPRTSVIMAALFEIGRIIIVVVLVVGGLILLGRRFLGAGWIVGLSTAAFFVVISTTLPAETRYLAPQFPVLYLAQAMFILYCARLAANLLLTAARPGVS